MVDVTDLPISGKIKQKFLSFLSAHPLEQINLGDFAKWDDCSPCAVCGHPLMWAYRSINHQQDVGICCASNIIALQACKGNFDVLNFKRQLDLTKKTILKRQREWELQQKVQALEIKYNDEFKFCSEIVNLAFNEPEFQEFIGERDGKKFFYADGNRLKTSCLSKIGQCNTWLSYMRDGVVNDFYLGKLRDLMKQSPREILEEAKNNLKAYNVRSAQESKDRELNYTYFGKVCILNKVRLAKFDIDFVKNLKDFFDTKGFYTEKQRASIDSLAHKYREQIGREEKLKSGGGI